jgi:hypothetical protein
VDEYELRADEVRILEHAARTADLIDDMHQALTDSTLTTAGSMGQVRPNPLLTEIRGHRLLLAQLLKQLKLPDESGGGQWAQNTSQKGRAAAMARWHRGGTRGA